MDAEVMPESVAHTDMPDPPATAALKVHPPAPAPLNSLWHRGRKRLERAVMGAWWRRRFAAFGAGSFVDLPAYLVGHESISIGPRVRVWRHTRIEARNPKRGEVRIEIGENTGVQPYVHIGAAELVSIGKHCRIAQGVYITDHDHDYSDLDDLANLGRRTVSSPVRIDDRVWLGERVIVLKGVHIGERTVVGAGSVVTRSLPACVIAVGNPAKVIRVWNSAAKRWERP
jgi:lipopolysaccharide O-acetyltransferase